MFYSSSKHPFDITFVILCVIAGANSHTAISNKSPSNNQLHTRYRTSFIDTILDAGLIEIVQSSNIIRREYAAQARTLCASLSSAFDHNQINYCYKHQDILESILPQIIQITKTECARITSDLKWNCTSINPFLDRTNSLSFTREAALIRSLLNASMMYLIVKICSESSHRSCGCQTHRVVSTVPKIELQGSGQQFDFEIGNRFVDPAFSKVADQIPFGQPEMERLDAGLPIRFAKSIMRYQDCLASVAFANALTKVFMDSDDVRSLNRAHKFLNEDHNHNNYNKRSKERRLIDADYKDLSFIKWTKSAVNLHNNHVGRQLVREATHKRCRCHGLSGVCQFQTCWDELPDFKTISSQIRALYLTKSIQVESVNLGTYEEPDLCLSKKVLLPGRVSNNSGSVVDTLASSDRKKTCYRTGGEGILFLFDSPEYCDPVPKGHHPGTRGRLCTPIVNISDTIQVGKRPHTLMKTDLSPSALGICEQVCCKRGYSERLAFDLVGCKCKFKFCCKVECERCLIQRLQHFCI